MLIDDVLAQDLSDFPPNRTSGKRRTREALTSNSSSFPSSSFCCASGVLFLTLTPFVLLHITIIKMELVHWYCWPYVSYMCVHFYRFHCSICLFVCQTGHWRFRTGTSQCCPVLCLHQTGPGETQEVSPLLSLLLLSQCLLSFASEMAEQLCYEFRSGSKSRDYDAAGEREHTQHGCWVVPRRPDAHDQWPSVRDGKD